VDLDPARIEQLAAELSQPWRFRYVFVEEPRKRVGRWSSQSLDATVEACVRLDLADKLGAGLVMG